jgi:hypothetical protein
MLRCKRCCRWWAVFLTGLDYRAHLLAMHECQNVLIHNLRFINSPLYHIFIDDGLNVVVRCVGAAATACC